MVCIDEAHEISTWGLDFRSSYTKLNVIREWIPDIPILTLTATASTKVREDISNILSLSDPELIIGNFDRPNLLIRVLPRCDDVVTNILNLLYKYKDEYAIIYCKTRDETDLITQKISAIGIKCDSYHAGMSDKARAKSQQDFIDGTTKCIVATIAFGMGINITSVRLVVHFNCPKNIESYYQEIGRAGRDGNPSECVLFFSLKDFKTNRYFLQSISNPIQKVYQEDQIKQIEKYVYSNECRRKIILQNFGQYINSCTNCDNCLNSINNKKKNIIYFDYTKPVYLIFNVLSKINDKFGSGMIINILLGKKSKVKSLRNPKKSLIESFSDKEDVN
jgi:ATP-dependent DNA helicase RecQ